MSTIAKIIGYIVIIGVIFCFAAACLATAAVAAPSDDTRGVVTIKEWRDLHRGMTKAQVRKALDGPGRKGQPQTRWYKLEGSSPKHMRVIVTYVDGKLRHGYIVSDIANGGTFNVPVA